MDKNNIILIGMSGVGKTTVGEELIKIFPDYELVDTDKEIEIYANKTIPEIFEEFGEGFFRHLEKDIIQKTVSKSKKQIISTGGGAFEDDYNRKLFLDCGTVVYLKADADTIYNRIKSENNRPLLKDLSIEKIEALMQPRIKNYETAHIIIDTNNETPYNIAREVKRCLK